MLRNDFVRVRVFVFVATVPVYVLHQCLTPFAFCPLVQQVQSEDSVLLFVVAWTVTEIIRYSFYTFSLLNHLPYLIKWARYNDGSLSKGRQCIRPMSCLTRSHNSKTKQFSWKTTLLYLFYCFYLCITLRHNFGTCSP